MTGKADKAESGPAALIVFGLDESGKPHASTFGEADAELAIKAAGLMGMRTLPVETDEHREIAAKLPQGRVFESGRGFVPFVKAALYDRLAALSGATGEDQAEPTGQGAETPEPPPAGSPAPENVEASTPGLTASMPMPNTWAEIQVGTLVLVAEGLGHGFFEGIVVGEPGPDLFRVKFRDWPDEPLLVRKRQHLALLHPTDSGRT